jgi:hypothetical protein
MKRGHGERSPKCPSCFCPPWCASFRYSSGRGDVSASNAPQVLDGVPMESGQTNILRIRAVVSKMLHQSEEPKLPVRSTAM